MKGNKLLLIALVAFAILLSGCLEPTFCGDGICQSDSGETPENCPIDCPPETGAVNVAVTDYLGPVEGATVKLYLSTGELKKEMLTGSDGLAFFTAVAPGSYFLTAEKTGYGLYTSGDLTLSPNETIIQPVYLGKIGVGLATVLIGNDVLTLFGNRQYPYIPGDIYTANDYWKASFDLGHNPELNVETLKRINVYNNVTIWDRVEPLMPNGRAIFLQSTDPNALGFDFARVEFLGETSPGIVSAEVSSEGATTSFSQAYNSAHGTKPEFVETITDSYGSRSYRYNGSTYATNLTQSIGLIGDAVNYDPNLVVMYIGAGDFNYVLDLGGGIPIQAAAGDQGKFVDGDNDNIVIPFFSEEYTVYEIDTTITPNKILLMRESGMVNYFEGQVISNLEGAGQYSGQEMSVKLAAIIQYSSTSPYWARFELYDQVGNVVDVQTVSRDVDLRETFLDSTGAYALKTPVYVRSILVSPGPLAPAPGPGGHGPGGSGSGEPVPGPGGSPG